MIFQELLLENVYVLQKPRNLRELEGKTKKVQQGNWILERKRQKRTRGDYFLAVEVFSQIVLYLFSLKKANDVYIYVPFSKY